MYCNQCGNILTEHGAFCSFCGAKNEDAVVKASEPDTAAIEQAAPAASEASVPAPEVAALVQEPAPQPVASVYAPPITPAGFTGEMPAPPVTQPVKEEKYYTFNHILLCLGAVAVMAIVAGVFAGLYFSTF